MNVAYHSSDVYSRILGVSIVSLLENNKKMDEINIYIVERGITENNKATLDAIAKKYGRKMYFIPMPDINVSEDLRLKKVKKIWLFDSYCRLFLHDLLPKDIDKVLYLDSDVLVADDLDKLWNTDLSNTLAAGVKDCINSKYYDLLELKENAHYCNSGVILINLKKWRDTNMGDQIRNYLHERNGYVFFMEQTVMNGIIQDQWRILDAKYNVNTLMLILNYKEIQTLRRIDDFYSVEEVEKAVENPALIHMTNVFLVHNRVWVKGSNHPAKKIYDKYKAMTPWADKDDLPDTRTVGTKLRDRVIDWIPNGLLLPCVGFIYNDIRIMHIKRITKKNRS